MQLRSASRPTRVRRLLAVSAAAAAVMIAPTACDYGGYGAGAHSGDMGDMGDMPGMDHGSKNPAQDPVVVPVGNTKEASADNSTATATSAARSDRRRHRPSRGHGQTSAATTTAAPAPGAPATDPATDPAAPTDTTVPADGTTDTAVPPPPATGAGSVGAGGKDGKNNGLDILGRDCTQSKLPAHNGFQESPACVSTQMGEVAAKDKLPSLLIVDAPKTVGVGQAFTLKISTRNLIRDRFLGAKAGGYYLESSFLDPNSGLQRGHFHTACRILPTTSEAPDSSADPEFFLATEDKGGSDKPDVVTIQVLAENNKAPGELQCTSWAGDGSHRTPMMTQANETPAIDSVRITVTNDNAPPAGYAQVAGNDPAAAQADLAKQADAKQAEAGAQQPDVEQNGNTETGQGVTASGPPASAAAQAPPAAPAAPATSEAPADTAPADTASDAPAADAPAGA
jgi:hypothetical protein